MTVPDLAGPGEVIVKQPSRTGPTALPPAKATTKSMNTLQPFRSLAFRSRLTSSVTLITLCLFGSVLWSSVSAQSLPSRPVARLISSTSDEVPNSRGRRLSVATNDVSRAEAPAAISRSITHPTETERRAFEATNKMRARNGFAPLSWDSDLCLMARAHSERMAQLGFFGHQTPEGRRLKDRARAAGIRFQVIGENIAYNQDVDDPGTFAVQIWMISSGHRANILSREFRSSGIGSFLAQDGRVYLTQIFIAR